MIDIKFLVNGRWYKTPCKTVLKASSFTVAFFTGKHTILADVSDKCYFTSVDNNSLTGIKTDFYIGIYNSPKELIKSLCDSFDSFLNTSIRPKEKRIVFTGVDRVIEAICEISRENTKKLEKQNVEKIDKQDVNLNNFTNVLIKAVGIKNALEVRYAVHGVNVIFEYQGEMYKCYTPQSKLYKLNGSCFNLITWKSLKKESSEKSDDKSDVVYTVRPPPEASLLNLSRKNKLIKREDF